MAVSFIRSDPMSTDSATPPRSGFASLTVCNRFIGSSTSNRPEVRGALLEREGMLALRQLSTLMPQASDERAASRIDP